MMRIYTYVGTFGAPGIGGWACGAEGGAATTDAGAAAAGAIAAGATAAGATAAGATAAMKKLVLRTRCFPSSRTIA